MGKKDITEKNLVAYNDVFADISNVLLFQGRQVIEENSLVAKETNFVYKDDGKLHEQIRDVSKFWTQGKTRLAVLGLENQTQEDAYMPMRIIGYDGALYRSQYQHSAYPVVTMVLHFGTERRWSKAKDLYGCLNIPAELAPYVSNYKIHVFDIAFLPEEQIQLFQSDFRIVADYFSQVRKNKDYVPSQETIQHVDAVLKLMSVLTGDQRFEEAQKQQGGVITMCEVLDKAEKRGVEIGMAQGIERGIEALILDNLEDGKSEAVILEKLKKRFQLDDAKAQAYFTKYAYQNSL